MDVHENARLTPRRREQMVNRVFQRRALNTVAMAFVACEPTVRRYTWHGPQSTYDLLAVAVEEPHPRPASDAANRPLVMISIPQEEEMS